MNRSDYIILIAKENNGAITTSDLSKKRIRRGNQKHVDAGRKKYFANDTALFYGI